MKKKIIFITGTRADYGKLKSLMKSADANENFECYIFVCGMHLLHQYGNTYNGIINEGYKNVHIARGIIYSSDMSINLGNTITYLTGYVKDIVPDMIIVHGDRIDALAGAIVGALNNIWVSHIEGGEISGTIDESIRHAVSKFAHFHFVANDEAANRLIQLGEKKDNIFVIGSPDIDVMLSSNLPDLAEVKRWYKLRFDKYAIMLYHPVTTEVAKLTEKVEALMNALKETKRKYVIIYPNNDTGTEVIISNIEKVRATEYFEVYKTLKFEYFLTLLKNADFIIGNSSAGIREACVYGIPAIDIGTRQKNRYDVNVLKNILHCGESKEEILGAINKISEERFQAPSNVFGKGNTTELFMNIILQSELWDREMQKHFIDTESPTQ
ncbi:MAG: UDP-N-acetyl-D-glucosamine 2-epimerase, UDP-hydrolyzing [Lachnospiraceae bacterium]|jgi:UDP-N-acetylglucosamine 2-epimerase (hydrolysing)|nr:UDP-N-acetyl-D-glucosamine 2-epimerase, UDP-hydrolyzing [Lachnospiraceae bacterium]